MEHIFYPPAKFGTGRSNLGVKMSILEEKEYVMREVTYELTRGFPSFWCVTASVLFASNFARTPRKLVRVLIPTLS